MLDAAIELPAGCVGGIINNSVLLDNLFLLAYRTCHHSDTITIAAQSSGKLLDMRTTPPLISGEYSIERIRTFKVWWFCMAFPSTLLLVRQFGQQFQYLVLWLLFRFSNQVGQPGDGWILKQLGNGQSRLELLTNLIHEPYG